MNYSPTTIQAAMLSLNCGPWRPDALRGLGACHRPPGMQLPLLVAYRVSAAVQNQTTLVNTAPPALTQTSPRSSENSDLALSRAMLKQLP